MTGTKRALNTGESKTSAVSTGAVFIDLRKAFDTVDHELLILKLKSWIFNFSCQLVSLIFIITYSSYIYQQHVFRSKTSYCRCTTK